MREIFPDAELQQHFERTGYVRFTMLSPAEVNEILTELGKLRPNDGFAPGGNKMNITYHCSFLDTNVEYKRQTHQLITGIFAPHIEKHLTGFEILNCNFYVKPPHTGEFAIHQNWPAIADMDDTTVTVWCPLVDVVESNGALQVVEGSHKIVPHIEGPTNPGFFRDFKEELIQKYLKPVPMKAGDCIVFDDGLIHWSAQNDSDEARIAIQILCVPKDAQPVYYYFDKDNPNRFELIEVNSEFYVESQIPDLMKRQPHWKSLGFVENKNRFLTEDEFAELLQTNNARRNRK